MNKIELEIKSLIDLEKVYLVLEKHLNPKTLFLLEGDLASGKTTLVHFIATKYGLNLVSSPTYSFIQNYKNDKIEIVHVDLYRLQSSEEIESIGFWEIFGNTKATVFVEWPSKVNQQDWPLDWTILNINIIKINENYRRLNVVF